MNEQANEAPDLEQRYRKAVGATELAGEDYAAAIGSKDPERRRNAREAFRAAQDGEHQALTELVESHRPTTGVRPTFAALLNDPAQQLDTNGEVLAWIYAYQDLTCDTACACTDPKCPRHL